MGRRLDETYVQNIVQPVLLTYLQQQGDELLHHGTDRATQHAKMFDNFPNWNDHQTSLLLNMYGTTKIFI